MGINPRDYRVTVAALHDAIANEAKALSTLAAPMGASLAIDPHLLLQRDITLRPATDRSPNGHCQLVQTADGWIAINLARADDRDAVAAWLEIEGDAAPWDAIAQWVPLRTSAELLERAELLGMPVSAVGETPVPCNPVPAIARSRNVDLSAMSVVDLSALWAGPLCGDLLSEAGMTVTKVEDPARPDPTRLNTPKHDHRLNGRKKRASIALSDPALLEAIVKADIVITSARPQALARLGLTPDVLFSLNPASIWVAITAHGFYGPGANRVGFGDDCAAAGGLIGWADRNPHFLGDALADPLTGLRAAHWALHHIATGQSGLIDVALAPIAADFARQAGLR